MIRFARRPRRVLIVCIASLAPSYSQRRSRHAQPRRRQAAPVVDAPAGALARTTRRRHLTSSRAFPMPRRRSARCAGSRRRRCRPGRACARRREFGPACIQPTTQAHEHLRGRHRADERGLPDAQRLGARGRAQRAGVRLDPRRRAVGRLEPRAALRRRAAGRARRRRRLDQLPARRARLARASRAQRGIAARRLGQLRPARPDRGAALGASDNIAAFGGDPAQRHHRRRVRRRAQRHVPDGLAARRAACSPRRSPRAPT